jgi:hypothetical protein
VESKSEYFSVGLVKGSNPEKFVIVWVDQAMHIKKMTFLSEKEVRDALTQMQIDGITTESLIQFARSHPV